MTKLMMSALLVVSIAACSKKKASCEDVFTHTKSLMPAEMGAMLDKKKASAIEKCEKLSDEARQCALDAKSMEELQKCPR